MYDIGLADRIERKGIEVVRVAGWETRGSLTYKPRGTVNHHTAGSTHGTVPSLTTCIYGRPDVPGPLCQVLQSREPAGWDKAYVIAAGRANHAGRGGWMGLTGNSSVGGLEIEHAGVTGVTDARIEVAVRIQAALLEAPGSPRMSSLTCQHFEWAPTRKVDFRVLGMTPNEFRSHVAYWIGRTVDTPVPPVPLPDEDDLMYIADCKERPALWVSGGVVRTLDKAQRDALRALGVPAKPVNVDQHAALWSLDVFNERMDAVFTFWAADANSPLRAAIQAELEEWGTKEGG